MAKDHPRISAYGTLDELNSVLGLLCAEQLPGDAASHLEGIQNSLFAVGAALADSKGRYSGDSVQWSTDPVEEWIDVMESELQPLKNFILPGGCKEACLAHLARTVCRRAERRTVAVAESSGELPAGILEYLNRLSDLFFVLARWFNSKRGIADTQWQSVG